MTTIVCDRNIMVCDSNVVMDSLGVYPTNKFKRVGDSLYGIAGGDCTGAEFVLNWIQAGGEWKDRPSKKEYRGDYFILKLSPEGISIAVDGPSFERIESDFYAVGSGRKVARYCIERLGMGLLESVLESCEFDKPWSSPPLYWESLDGKKGIIKTKKDIP